jgi:hypothetical protein
LSEEVDLFTEVLVIEAKQRMVIHSGHSSRRRLSDDYELLGLVGEAEFARMFHQPLDLERRSGGDGGIDFVIPLAFKVDVKTARNPLHLIQEQGKVAADIYVLARYLESIKRAELIGWEWGPVLARAPVKEFGHGIVNHFIPADRLRPMSELGSRIMHLCGRGA